MDKGKLQQLGSEWKVLNERYDNLVLEIIDSSESVVLRPERKEEIKKIQQELFDLETKIFNV